MKALVIVVLIIVGFVATAALANQCPLLIKQIMDATSGKTDPASQKAIALANEASALHEAGRHAESIKKAEDAAAPINLRLKMRK